VVLAGRASGIDGFSSDTGSLVSNALLVSRLARWEGAGGNGIEMASLEKLKGIRQKKKPPGNQGGFGGG
jgi:hypothetical protein